MHPRVTSFCCALLTVIPVFADGTHGAVSRTPPRPLAEFSSAVEELASNASGAVVEITVLARTRVESNAAKKAGRIERSNSSGSGIVVDPNGYILTNAHVVKGARSIDVRVREAEEEGTIYSARLIGLDAETDLAVLKIDASHALPALAFADSDHVRQGQIAFALGSPMGLDNSLTAGYVSAPVRYVGSEGPVAYIQTDAPINPGNSGGPLLNIEGRVIGINTMILSQSGGSEGIGLAIPSNTAMRTYDQIKKRGHVDHGGIGVVSQDVTPVLSAALHLARREGVILCDVRPGSAADHAKLRPGDLVVAIEGHAVRSGAQLRAAVFQRSPGETIQLSIVRGTERSERKVRIGSQSGESAMDLEELAAQNGQLIRPLGILALTLDESMTATLPALQRTKGVVAAAIPAELDGANPGLEAGDVIYEVNGRGVTSANQLSEELSARKPGDPVALLVESHGTLGYVAFSYE